MKLAHIFWSLLILIVIAVAPNFVYRTNGKFNGGIDLYALFLLLWALVSLFSPIVLILRITGVISRDIRFLYTLLSVFNVYFGTLGIYKILTGQLVPAAPLGIPFFALNLVWAILTIIDTFRIRKRLRALAQHLHQ